MILRSMLPGRPLKWVKTTHILDGRLIQFAGSFTDQGIRAISTKNLKTKFIWFICRQEPCLNNNY